MIRLLMAALLLVSVNTVADTQVTHTFKDGDIIEAEEFNKNFDDLEAAIDTVLTATADGEAIALTSIAGGASAISLTTNHGTSETIVVTNSQGVSNTAIALTATGGGIEIKAGSVLTLNPGVGGLITKRAVQTVTDSATDPTAPQYVAGFINVTGGGPDTFVLPTGATLADAMVSAVSVGDSFICYVVNGSGGGITYATGASGSAMSAVGGSTLVQKNGSMAKLEFIFTGSTGGSEEYYVLLHADNA